MFYGRTYALGHEGIIYEVGWGGWPGRGIPNSSKIMLRQLFLIWNKTKDKLSDFKNTTLRLRQIFNATVRVTLASLG